MPSWFPEGDDVTPGDNPWRSLQKIVSLGVPAGGASTKVITEEGDTLITEEGDTVVTE